METNLYEYRGINILVDEARNIALFPVSKSDILFGDDVLALDEESKYEHHVAFFPDELKSPYSAEELAEKIEKNIGLWNCYEPYICERNKNITYEEKYYGIKGFKKAVKGKKYISLGWDDIEGKCVSLYLPCKTGYAYMGIETIELPDDADWIDFANAVIELINLDLPNHHRFKTFKKDLNL